MKLVLIFIILFTISSRGQSPFALYGSTPNNMNNKNIVLCIRDNYSDFKYEIRDTTIIRDNKFYFKGIITKPTEKAEISLFEKGQFFYFALDSGQSIMEIKSLPTGWPTYKNKLSNVEIKNSISNLINDSLRILTNYYYIKFGKPASVNKGVIQLDSVKNTELWLRKLAIIKNYPNEFYSIICLYSLLNEQRKKANDIKQSFFLLNDSLQKTALGRHLYEKIEFITSTYIGNKIPKIISQTNLGAPFSNKDLTGNVYLLIFGATWCKPCKDNYPTIRKLFSKYRFNGLKVVAVNLDDNQGLWNKQIVQFGLSDWIHISELKKMAQSEIAKRLSITYIPFYILMDKNGVIIYNTSQVLDPNFSILDNTIKDYLSK